MSDSGDPKRDEDRELRAQREFYEQDQPSPTNLSEQLKEKIRNTMADALALSKYDITDEAIAAITAAYAEAINEIIGEELDYDKYGKCPSCGVACMYQCTCDQGSLYTINQQRQRLQRLLPTNGSDEGSADKPHD